MVDAYIPGKYGHAKCWIKGMVDCVGEADNKFKCYDCL
jgi:hypothetical protein